jgi:hypothetical protein
MGVIVNCACKDVAGKAAGNYRLAACAPQIDPRPSRDIRATCHAEALALVDPRFWDKNPNFLHNLLPIFMQQVIEQFETALRDSRHDTARGSRKTS